MGRNSITTLGIFLVIAVFIFVFLLLFNGDKAIVETTEYGVDALEKLEQLNEELESSR